MLATARFNPSTMHGGKDDVPDCLLTPRIVTAPDGFLNLTRRIEDEEEDQFDVDLTILDFLVYKATGLIFEWKSSRDPYHSDLPQALVSMTADWRTFLKHRHQGRSLDAMAAFRSRLLQFTLVFTHRFHHKETWTTTESLAELQEQNKGRTKYWRERTESSDAADSTFNQKGEFPLRDSTLHKNRDGLAVLLKMPQDQRRWVSDVAGTPSLQCILPLFIELTAARIDLDDDWPFTTAWFDLAAEFMLQTVTEEYLRNGAQGDDAFNTAFAFGCPGDEEPAGEPPVVTAMRELFCDEDDICEPDPDWTNIKARYIKELLPQNASQSTLQALLAAEKRHPYAAFEERLLGFLKTLHDGLIKPDLAQVEDGRINVDGNEFSELESRDMIRRMGL